MERRRDALRRLGAPRRCTDCLGVLRPREGDRCGRCQGRAELALIREETGRLEREVAVLQQNRPSSSAYREACAAMQDDVDAALGAWKWPMGNGILGPRY